MTSTARVLKEALSGVEEALTAFAGEDQRVDQRDRRIQRFQGGAACILLEYEQLQARGAAGGPAGNLTSAAAWTQAYLEAKVFPRLGPLLLTISAKADVALTDSATRVARMNAVRAAQMPSLICFTLLDRLHCMVTVLAASRGGQQLALAKDIHARLIDPAMMDPTAGALRSLSALAPFVGSREGRQALAGSSAEAVAVLEETTVILNGSVGAGAKYALFAIQMLQNRMNENGATLRPGGALSDDVARGIEAFCSSGLLQATIAHILAVPAVKGAASSILYDLHYAAKVAVEAVMHTHIVFMGLALFSGPRPAALRAALAAVLLHPDVVQLQEVSLERLLVHAGMEDAVGSVTGASGPAAWWLLREEARRRALCGDKLESGVDEYDTAEHTAGWLEDQHCMVVQASLGIWRNDLAKEVGTRPNRAAAPLLPPQPSALQVARTAARVAEALCRLCRGQGVGGAYAPAPEWQFARTKALMLILDFAGVSLHLSPPEVRECTPYWLEAGAWALALAAEAEEAAVAGASTRRPRSAMSYVVSPGVQQIENLMHLLLSLDHLCSDPFYGMGAMSEDLRRDCRERLSRAGLAATLDRVLRLAFAAQERGTQAGRIFTGPPSAPRVVAGLLSSTSVFVLRLSALTAAASQASPSPPPPALRQLQQQGIGDGDQLGPLISAAKRGTVLAARLETLPDAAASTPASRGMLEEATAALWVLLNGYGNMSRELDARLEARRSAAAAAKAAGSGGTSTAATAEQWDAADARCLSEEHEAAAYVGRTIYAVAAPLARLAARLARKRSAARGGWDAESEDLLTELHSQVLASLGFLRMWSVLPGALPATQLLACQPHRLLAGAADLLASAPKMGPFCVQLGAPFVEAVVALASRQHVADHMCEWLAPPATGADPGLVDAPSGRTGDGAVGGGADAAERPPQGLRGCLVEPLLAAVPVLAAVHVSSAKYVPALLRLAAVAAPQPLSHRPRTADGVSEDGAGRRGELDSGTFVHVAASILTHLDAGAQSARNSDVVLPDGSRAADLLAQALAASRAAGGAPATASPAPLPPPLAIAASPAMALRRLRVCCNPACTNYERASEAALEPKQCSGCKAVRYCGADCQRLHWRAGHKGECAALKGI